jgi:hypothetical protein
MGAEPIKGLILPMFLAPWFSISAFSFPDFSFCLCFPPSGFSFQPFSVSVLCFVPVEQRARGLRLARREFHQTRVGPRF